jgi:hypothetical protein
MFKLAIVAATLVAVFGGGHAKMPMLRPAPFSLRNAATKLQRIGEMNTNKTWRKHLLRQEESRMAIRLSGATAICLSLVASCRCCR